MGKVSPKDGKTNTPKQKRRLRNSSSRYLKPGALAQIRYNKISTAKPCTDLGKKRVAVLDAKQEDDLVIENKGVDKTPLVLSPVDLLKQNHLVRTPKTPREEVSGSESRLEALPMDLLVKILCHLHHDQLRAVFHVSQRIRMAVVYARQFYFNYTTPDRSRQEMLKTTTPRPTEHWPFVSKGKGRGVFLPSPHTPKAPRPGPRPPSRMKITDMRQIAAVLFQDSVFPSRCMLEQDGEKAKKERKKEKKREKREKKKAWVSGDIESKKRSHKKSRKVERSNEDQKGGDLQKRTEKETEQLEKSCLTEEHGHPVGSQASSDSTLNNNKRQKLSSPLDGRHNSGSIIRIRLPSQRHKDPEVLSIKEQPFTALGRTDDAFIQLMHEPAPRLGNEAVEYSCFTPRKVCPELAIQPSKEKPPFSTRVAENSSQKPEKPCLCTGLTEGSAQLAEISVPSNLCGHCPPQLAPKFRDVIENWVPLLVQGDYTGLDDQEWLF